MSVSIVDITDRKPNDETVGVLEKMLAHARSGELRSVVMVVGWSDDSVTHHWSLDTRNGRRRLLGGITMLQHDMASTLNIIEGDSAMAKALYRMQE